VRRYPNDPRTAIPHDEGDRDVQEDVGKGKDLSRDMHGDWLVPGDGLQISQEAGTDQAQDGARPPYDCGAMGDGAAMTREWLFVDLGLIGWFIFVLWVGILMLFG